MSYGYFPQRFLIHKLTVCALLFCCGCSPQAAQKQPSKPPAVVTDSGPFNATDFEQAAIDFRRDGRLELAGAATERARQLRLAGDTSKHPTPVRVTAKGMDELAEECEAKGYYDLAQEAREAARYLRNKNRSESQPPPTLLRNKALML